MNVGYVRLSRDDDKRNYVSIDNQKLIIQQFAAERNMTVERWYEDDGFSGYKFDRPGFNQLLDDLTKDIDTVFVKDFSRLGRHNAKVLLLLDEFQEQNKHLIVIDDNYDSCNPDDDTIGIKTWYNERYVKDTSKKIKRALSARQKAGTLMTQPPFGYRRCEKDATRLEIISEQAACIKLAYDLYIKGFGCRKIANHLNGLGFPTPSMVRQEREAANGRITKRSIASNWSDGMVKNLLDNDFYIGTLRLRKRARTTVHGKDKRVPEEQQFIFENHHPAIINKAAFDLVQHLKEKRVKSNYRGSHGQWLGSDAPSPFGSCLFCAGCNSRLTPIRRQTRAKERKYYICTTYNTKGKRYCSGAHLVPEEDLMEDMLHYIKLCRDSLCEVIAAYDFTDLRVGKQSPEEKRTELINHIDERKQQLKILISQKIKDLSHACINETLIRESYDSLQHDILAQIHGLESQLAELEETLSNAPNLLKRPLNALEIMDQIIADGRLNRTDIETLVERIEVDENGFTQIELKYGLSGLLQPRPVQELNQKEHEIIYHAMQFLLAEERGFTSAKYLSAKLTEKGFPKSAKNVLPYIALLINLGIIERSENPRKPYPIIKPKDVIKELMSRYAGPGEAHTVY